jgi:hypothetical protein
MSYCEVSVHAMHTYLADAEKKQLRAGECSNEIK